MQKEPGGIGSRPAPTLLRVGCLHEAEAQKGDMPHRAIVPRRVLCSQAKGLVHGKFDHSFPGFHMMDSARVVVTSGRCDGEGFLQRWLDGFGGGVLESVGERYLGIAR